MFMRYLGGGVGHQHNDGRHTANFFATESSLWDSDSGSGTEDDTPSEDDTTHSAENAQAGSEDDYDCQDEDELLDFEYVRDTGGSDAEGTDEDDSGEDTTEDELDSDGLSSS